MQKVFALKRRSGAKSLVLLASDLDMVARYVRKIPAMAVDLVEVNDAPMTIVYPGAVVAGGNSGRLKSFGLAPSVVAEDGSVGIRIPRAAAAEGDRDVSAGGVFCNRLIYRFRRPVVSTSANISGEETPARFEDISEEIRSGVDYVVPPAVSRLGRFDDDSSGRPSQIIRLGLDGEVEIIRQ